MVHLAVYDAVVAIEGGSRPFAAKIAAAPGADVRAAVATAAYLTARPRIAAAHLAAFDQAYTTYLAALPAERAVTEGVRVGQQAAAAMLALRANDGFANVVPYECSAVPPPIGEFVPDTGCPTGAGAPQPVDAKVGGITPFTLKRADAFRPDGPNALESKALRARLRRDARLRRRRQHACARPSRPTSPGSGPRTPTCTGTAT